MHYLTIQAQHPSLATVKRDIGMKLKVWNRVNDLWRSMGSSVLDILDFLSKIRIICGDRKTRHTSRGFIPE